MWIKNVDRKELLDILLAGRPVQAENLFQEISVVDTSEDRLQLVWTIDPIQKAELPNVIVINKKQKRDFLAWALTYVTNFRPFTAFFRILDRENINDYVSPRKPSLNKFENACIGLILTEALTYVETHDIRKLTPNSCSRTYSFAMGRAVALNLVTLEEDAIINGWLKARQLTNQPVLNLRSDDLQLPWSILLELSGTSSFGMRLSIQKIVNACRDLVNYGDIQDHVWNDLIQGFPELTSVLPSMSGTREDRVLLIEKIFSTLATLKNKDEIICAFLYGYFAARIAPGSIDHVNLLIPYIKLVPSILLWYGFCAGLQKTSNIKNSAGGLGQRVARNILQPENVFDRPKCDVSLPELEVLIVDGKNLAEFRTDRLGQMEIEIAPCITTTVKWPAQQDFQQELFAPDASHRELAEIEADITLTLSKLENIRRRLSQLNKFSRTAKHGDAAQKSGKYKKRKNIHERE